MNISLELWTPENAAARVPWLNDPEVLRYLVCPRNGDYTLQDSLDYIASCQKRGICNLAIVADGEVVGSIMARPQGDPQLVYLSYFLGREHWGRGIMTRAVGLMLQHIRQEMPQVKRVGANAMAPNIGTQRVLEHNGFARTGAEKMEADIDGTMHRDFYYERTLAAKAKDISLVDWTPENAAARVPWLNDERVLHYLGGTIPYPYSLQDSLDYIAFCEKVGFHNFAVVADGEVVGGISIMPARNEPGRVNIGYFYGYDHWGRGIATRAVKLVLELIPRLVPGAVRVRAEAFEGNASSHKVLLNNGFRRLDITTMAKAFGNKEYPLGHYEFLF